MKKISSLVFLILSLFAFSQEYHFDTSFIINTKRLSSDEVFGKTTVRINSLDRSFIFYEYPDNTIVVFDEKKNLNCFYEKVNTHNEISYQLKNCTKTKKSKSNEIEFEKITVSKISENKYVIETFKKENSKVSNFSLKLKLKPVDKDLLVLHLDMNKSIKDKLLDKLKSYLGSSNYYIESAEIDNKNGYYFIETMENLKQDNLIVK